MSESAMAIVLQGGIPYLREVQQALDVAGVRAEIVKPPDGDHKG